MTHIVLAGAGHAHLQVLRAWGRQLPSTAQAGTLRLTLVSPHSHMTYSGMVPGYVAGRYDVVDCQIQIARVVQPLVEAARAMKLQFECRQTAVATLNANTRHIGCADGSELTYDLLSLDVGGAPDKQAIPGAAEHALWVRPIEQFVQLWPRLHALAQSKPLHVAVAGGGAGGVELAFAVAQALALAPSVSDARGAVTLLTGGSAEVNALLPSHPPGVRQRIVALLRQQGVTVLQDRLVAVEPGADGLMLRLASGASLACDAPLMALPVVGPAWLRGSGLALNEQGFVQTTPSLQCTSHPSVFAAGDVANRADAPRPRSGVYALRTGPPLARNLALALQGQALQPYTPQRVSLNLLDTADGGAVLSWGPLAAGSPLTRPMWGAWKRWLDEGFVKSLS